jgi:hypothetical protein
LRISRENALIRERVDDLLDEEGIALGLVEDETSQTGGVLDQRGE